MSTRPGGFDRLAMNATNRARTWGSVSEFRTAAQPAALVTVSMPGIADENHVMVSDAYVASEPARC